MLLKTLSDCLENESQADLSSENLDSERSPDRSERGGNERREAQWPVGLIKDDSSAISEAIEKVCTERMSSTISPAIMIQISAF